MNLNRETFIYIIAGIAFLFLVVLVLCIRDCLYVRKMKKKRQKKDSVKLLVKDRFLEIF